MVVLPHPSGRRRMTVRELAAIQSFPLGFEFVGSRTSAYLAGGKMLFHRHWHILVASIFPVSKRRGVSVRAKLEVVR